jgi:FkbM family methyltransferase
MYVLAEQRRAAYGDIVHPGDIVLDCGANVGAFTKTALSKGAAVVVAIDPVPSNVDSLRRNFAHEISTGRVIICPKGVWDQTATLPMSIYRESALDSFVMSTRPEEATAPHQVLLPVTTIDKLVEELHLTQVDVIKMDVEGAERQALAGATRTLAKFRPRLAVATENLPDDVIVIPKVVHSTQPQYRVQEGACALLQFDRLAPEVLHFE